MNKKSEQTTGLEVKIIIEPDDAGYHAYCPDLDGVYASGETEEQALKKAQDAAIACFQCCSE